MQAKFTITLLLLCLLGFASAGRQSACSAAPIVEFYGEPVPGTLSLVLKATKSGDLPRKLLQTILNIKVPEKVSITLYTDAGLDGDILKTLLPGEYDVSKYDFASFAILPYTPQSFRGH